MDSATLRTVATGDERNRGVVSISKDGDLYVEARVDTGERAGRTVLVRIPDEAIDSLLRVTRARARARRGLR